MLLAKHVLLLDDEQFVAAGLLQLVSAGRALDRLFPLAMIVVILVLKKL